MNVPSLGVDVVASASAFEVLGHGITDEYLRHHCGTDDLEDVNRLEITVNADEQPIESLGTSCPFLQELKLTDSYVPSIRALGIALTNLRVLWLPRVGLVELFGMSALPQLEELYVSFNEIDDLNALSYHENLQVVDLEGNNVSDWDEVDTLETLPQLRELTLQGNPLSSRPDYARKVCEKLPDLEMLDDQLVASLDFGALEREDSKEREDGKDLADTLSAEASTEVGTDNFADEPDEDLLLLESIKKKHATMMIGQSSTARPATSAGRGWTPSSASAPPSVRPSTSYTPLAWGSFEEESDASELTQGCEKGLAGNPLRLCRHRRSTAPRPEDSSLDIRTLLERFRTFSQPSCLSDAELAARKLDADARPRTGQVSVRISRGRPMTAAMLQAMEEETGENVPAPVIRGKGEVFTLEDM
jgi:hypothetical protein